jgi:hypothetical protein
MTEDKRVTDYYDNDKAKHYRKLNFKLNKQKL